MRHEVATIGGMPQVTRILSGIEQGDPHAAEQLLPLVYQELRQQATQKLAQEKPGQTLQATALVHEAYLRLVNTDKVQTWNSRGHFFAAAAEAMRRILVEQARRKGRGKRGGGRQLIDLGSVQLATDLPGDALLALDKALSRTAQRRSADRPAGQAALLCRPVNHTRRAGVGPIQPDGVPGLGLRPGLALPQDSRGDAARNTIRSGFGKPPVRLAH
jgi:RNA polymerase sigma factor (TIGR02999 family)